MIPLHILCLQVPSLGNDGPKILKGHSPSSALWSEPVPWLPRPGLGPNSVPPQSSPHTEAHPCHTCRVLVDSFNKVVHQQYKEEGAKYCSNRVESWELWETSLYELMSQLGSLLFE